MVTLSLGNKKKTYRSIKEAATANGLSYMTLYMRLRFGQKPTAAIKRPVRKYNRQTVN